MLLMKMAILSLGKNYSIMDSNQRVLGTISLDAGQNLTGALIGSAVSQVAGGYVGRWAARRREYEYEVKDSQGQLAMHIRKGKGGNTSVFQVVDAATGGSFGHIDMKRSFIGGLKAAWVAPDGSQLMSSKGNILRRKYAIVGANGAELGKVRHKILAVRDVWQLELGPGTNHLYSAIFATILDFEKQM
ncbi:MAG: hypothetical protein L3J95_02655 [Thermoplasmata archaeon]|nr:hypothetical protein [Thermoplasmata archaeon]